VASLDLPGANGTALVPDGPSAERAEIEVEIERARRRVAASMRTLGAEVARRGDWREWVRAHPALVLAGAMALGAFFGRASHSGAARTGRSTR
jgi:hypothetical protein